jgi:hypothetical protein
MSKIKLTALIWLISMVPVPANAAEITTCIIDTSLKSNPVFYYFPITTTKLRCDHIKDKTSISMADLYKSNWRLIQVVSPIQVDQKDKQSAYTPPVIYMERTEIPKVVQSIDKPADTIDNIDDSDSLTEEQQSTAGGGLFNWLKGNSESDSSDE